MTPKRIAAEIAWAEDKARYGDMCDVDPQDYLDLLAAAEREAKLREACEDYLKWVRTPHHHLPIQETINQRREILERMEAALESKGGE